MSDSFLSRARYGKDKVRVFRVVREGTLHTIVEYNVTVLLEGKIETRYLRRRYRWPDLKPPATPKPTIPASSPRIR